MTMAHADVGNVAYAHAHRPSASPVHGCMLLKGTVERQWLGEHKGRKERTGDAWAQDAEEGR